jgi:hypothetical protein
LKLQITKYKLQTNHKPQITMYKQRGPSGILFTPAAKRGKLGRGKQGSNEAVKKQK